MTETVATALRHAAQRLAETSDTARLDGELLMAHALGVTRSEMLLRHMAAPVPATFAALIDRRAGREPVAYLLGGQEFFGLSLAVSPAVLIPRGDSECVVEAALAAAPDAHRVLDLGTGSGALLLALLVQLPAAEGIGVDASPDALAVARDNAERLGMAARARMLLLDWTVPHWAEGLGTFDLVIANPPYVETSAALDPDVRDFEPAAALFAGPEGLDHYRILVPQLIQLLPTAGVAVLEIGANQAEPVGSLAQAHGFAVEVRRDLGGRTRALVLRLTLGKDESSS